jgi:hypothetical protein
MISHRISLQLASELFIGVLLFIPSAQAGKGCHQVCVIPQTLSTPA